MRAHRTGVLGTLALALPLFVSGSAFADPPAPGRSAPPGAVNAGSGPSRAARAATAVRPVNLLCPVMTGTPVDPAFTSVWDGKLIGFSSADAKGRWDRSPSAFARNLDAHALDLFSDSGEPPPAAEPESVAASTPSAEPSVAPRPRVAAAPATRTAAPPPAAPRTGAAAPQARPTTVAAAPAPSAAPAPRAQTPAPRTSAPVRAPSATRWVDSAPAPCPGGT